MVLAKRLLPAALWPRTIQTQVRRCNLSPNSNNRCRWRSNTTKSCSVHTSKSPPSRKSRFLKNCRVHCHSGKHALKHASTSLRLAMKMIPDGRRRRAAAISRSRCAPIRWRGTRPRPRRQHLASYRSPNPKVSTMFARRIRPSPIRERKNWMISIAPLNCSVRHRRERK